MIILVALLAGLLLGLARGGHVSGLLGIRIRGAWLALAAAVTQSLLRGPAGDHLGLSAELRVMLWLVSAAGVMAVAAANIRTPGMSLVFTGFLMNAIVIAFNRGMPVTERALRIAGGDASETNLSGFYTLARPGTRVPWLGDAIPLAGPVAVRSVLSFGDILLLMGVTWIVYRGVTSGRTQST